MTTFFPTSEQGPQAVSDPRCAPLPTVLSCPSRTVSRKVTLAPSRAFAQTTARRPIRTSMPIRDRSPTIAPCSRTARLSRTAPLLTWEQGPISANAPVVAIGPISAPTSTTAVGLTPAALVR